MSIKYKKSEDVPSRVLAQRLKELAHAIADGKTASSGEFTMRIPAELDRDADLVMMEAARRLRFIEPASANQADEPASAQGEKP